MRRRGDATVERLSQDGADGSVGGLPIQTHAPTQEVIRIEVAQVQIGIGNRGQGAALAITGRTRVSAG